MRFHWYWPHARPEELDWAVATARTGDSIVVQVLDRPEAPSSGTYGSVRVVSDLPDVERKVRRALWAPSRTWTYVQRDRRRRALWRRGAFDLQHIHYLNRFTDAVATMPTPLVLSVHDVLPHVSRLGHRTEQSLLRRTYGRADALVVHHESLRDQLIRDFAIDPERIFIVPHQVFPVPPVGPPPDDRAPMLLMFGALRPNKGLEVLAESLALASDLDVRVVIAGRGDQRLERLALEMARSDARVTAEVGHASLERKHELFAEASAVLLPYTAFTSQSGVLHDAYGHGRPVVCTDVGALGATVRADGTGVVAPPGDPAAFASGIREVLRPAAWAACADAARRVSNEGSPSVVGARLREVYEEVLNR